MHADLLAVEQLTSLSSPRQAGQAAGMDSGTGRKWAIAAGAAADLATGQNGHTADMQADDCGKFPLGNQGKATGCSAVCHTLPLDRAGLLDGGGGGDGELSAALYNTLGRSKFIHIAPGAPAGRKQPRTCKNRLQKKEGAAVVDVVVVGAASVVAWGKSLLGREKESGAICAVRLMRHGAKAAQFATGQVLRCTPVGLHEFQYEGGKAA